MEAATKQPEKRAPTPRENPREAGRAGGVASGAARRAARGPRYWGDVLADAIAANPERVVKNLLASRNGAALAKALEFVRDLEDGKRESLRAMDERTVHLDELCCSLMDDVAAEQGARIDCKPTSPASCSSGRSSSVSCARCVSRSTRRASTWSTTTRGWPMRLHRRRQPEPVVPVVQQSSEAVVAPRKRRTRAEVANDRIEAEQLALHEREVELQRVRDAARREWEANRPPEPWGVDMSGFTF
jgi:hypothetical protein